MNVFQSIDAAFQQPAIAFLERTASGLCGALADPMRAALTLYVLWFGILVLRGAVKSRFRKRSRVLSKPASSRP